MNMQKIRGNFVFIVFLLPAIFTTIKFITIPNGFDWSIFAFLCIMVIFDRVNQKTFAGFGYSFFNVILSLIIFDEYSIVYGFFYLLVDGIVAIVVQRKGSLQSVVSLLSIHIMVIILCNEFYNEISDQSYAAKYVTLLLMLGMSLLLKYIYLFLETGFISSKLFIENFAPIIFEVLMIFPILSFFEQLEVNLVLILFLSYYSFVGYVHRKFKDVNESYISKLTNKITEKYNLQIIITDLRHIKGIYYAEKNIIAIDCKLDYPEQLQTIVHEMIHYRVNKRMRIPRGIEEVITTVLEAIISWCYIITIKNSPEIE